MPESDGSLPTASSYAELQSLPFLLEAVRRPPVPERGTSLQARRALLQASEVVLLNAEDLMSRVAASVAGGSPAQTVRLLEWLAAVMKTWTVVAERLPDFSRPAGPAGGFCLDITQSSNWPAFCAAEEGLARGLEAWLRPGTGPHAGAGEHDDAADAATRLVLRVSMLERLVLEYVSVTWPLAVTYEDLVRQAEIRVSVEERSVPGTVFMEFRTTHQVPEILVDCMNDHIECALELIEKKEGLSALPVLSRVQVLLDCAVRTLDLLVENLRQDEYHAIRAHLGLTSGSHSAGLSFHLMRDLYPALARRLAGTRPPAMGEQEWNLLRDSGRAIGLLLDRWRLAHLNLPRNSLGEAGTGTRSLVGSRDALQTVSKIREHSRRADPLINAGPDARTTDWRSGDFPLAGLERLILADTAEVTQGRFTDVQERRGRFGAAPSFQPPAHRRPAADMGTGKAWDGSGETR